MLLLPATGSTPLAAWKVTSNKSDGSHLVKRVYEKELKGYCCVLASQNARLVHGDAPSLDLKKSAVKKSATILHPYVLLQLLVPSSTVTFNIEIIMQNRRRYQLSTSVKDTKVTPLHTSVPINHILKRDVWMSILIDLFTLTMDHYRFCEFRSFDTISLQGNGVRVRQIFTMRYLAYDDQRFDPQHNNAKELALNDATIINRILEDPENIDEIVPRQLSFSPAVFWSWVIIPDHIRHAETTMQLDSQTLSESRRKVGTLKKTDSVISTMSFLSRSSLEPIVEQQSALPRLSLPKISLTPQVTTIEKSTRKLKPNTANRTGSASSSSVSSASLQSKTQQRQLQKGVSAPQLYQQQQRYEEDSILKSNAIPRLSQAGAATTTTTEGQVKYSGKAKISQPIEEENTDISLMASSVSTSKVESKRKVLQRINSVTSSISQLSLQERKDDTEKENEQLDITKFKHSPEVKQHKHVDMFDREVQEVIANAPNVTSLAYEDEYESCPADAPSDEEYEIANKSNVEMNIYTEAIPMTSTDDQESLLPAPMLSSLSRSVSLRERMNSFKPPDSQQEIPMNHVQLASNTSILKTDALQLVSAIKSTIEYPAISPASEPRGIHHTSGSYDDDQSTDAELDNDHGTKIEGEAKSDNGSSNDDDSIELVYDEQMGCYHDPVTEVLRKKKKQ